MGVYDDLPVLDLSLIPLRRFRISVVDDGFEGGRNGNNEPQAISLSAGGRVVATLEPATITSKAQHDYINWLDARMSGGFRYILVPIMSDWIGPFPTVGGIPQIHDGMGDPTVTATAADDFAAGAGVIEIALSDDSVPMTRSGWISMSQTGKGHRATRIWNIISHSTPDYEIAISPPLRGAIVDEQAVRIVRPIFTARFPAGFTTGWDVQGFWQGNPTIEFVEAP